MNEPFKTRPISSVMGGFQKLQLFGFYSDKQGMAAYNFRDKRMGSNDLDISDLGAPDTVRYNVLTFVVNEEYDRAIGYLKDYLERDSTYPNYKEKIDRYVQHAIDLISAIRTKRNFPGMSLLTKSKQNELREKFREHFQELKSVMRKIETCQEELRLTDIKSTTMLVKSIWFSVVIIFVAALVIEFFSGMGSSFYIVFDDYLGKGIDLVYNYLDKKN